MILDFHNNWRPMAILAFITVLNVSLIISVLTSAAGSLSFIFDHFQLAALVGLELAAVILAYLVGKHSKVIAAL